MRHLVKGNFKNIENESDRLVNAIYSAELNYFSNVSSDNAKILSDLYMVIKLWKKAVEFYSDNDDKLLQVYLDKLKNVTKACIEIKNETMPNKKDKLKLDIHLIMD